MQTHLGINPSSPTFLPQYAFGKRRLYSCLSKFPDTEVPGDLFALNRADIMGSGRPRHEQVRLVEEFESLVEHFMTEAPPLSRYDLAVSGFDLMRLGIPPNDQLGRIQNALLQEVLDEPRRNNRDYLLSRAIELMK